jgi:hypothetical protein
LEEVVKKPKGRQPRKKSAAPLPNRNGSNPKISSRLKELWADPVWAEAQREKQRIAMAKRRGTNTFRAGIPDGMRKGEAADVWVTANESAKKTVTELAKKGVINPDEDPRAVEALEFNLTTMRGAHDIRSRLAAAAKVLEYTKSKPVAKSEVTLNKAEDWLASVAASETDETADESEPSEDAQEAS